MLFVCLLVCPFLCLLIVCLLVCPYIFLLSGISSYIHDPQKAFASLEPLLDFAASQIPQSSHRDILLFVLATAGVRLATQEKQEKLLNVLRTNIRSRYSFHLPDSHVEVLTGKLEGK